MSDQETTPTPRPWKMSISELQRHYRLGYAHAATLFDDLHPIVHSHEVLVEAVAGFLAKWAHVKPAIDSAFVLQSVHGMDYRGPTIVDELQALEAALKLAQASEDQP